MTKKSLLAVLFGFAVLLPVVLFATPAFAEDCMQDPITDTDWNAEVTTGARLRDIPCMETSVVITTLPVGEVIKVIAVTDGYYKIRRANGTEGWVGQWLIAATDNPFTPAGTTPAPTPSTPAPTERLYDIKGHKYETAIYWMDQNKIISGYPDLSFKPDSTLNRAEFMKIMSLTYDLLHPANDFLLVQDDYDIPCFNDIVPGQWYTEYVCYAKEKGIIEGYQDGSFGPDRKISKVEALKIVLKSLEMPMTTSAAKNYFADTELAAWYTPYLQTAYENNLIEEPAGASYYPGKDILRGEASNLVYETYLLKTL